jgi:hypothetical protein
MEIFPCKNCIVMFGYDDNELHYIGYIRKNHMIGVDMLNNITMLIESGDDFDEEKPLVHDLFARKPTTLVVGGMALL